MLIAPDGLQCRQCCCYLYNSGRAQILETVNLVQFFTVDPDVDAVAIWVVAH